MAKYYGVIRTVKKNYEFLFWQLYLLLLDIWNSLLQKDWKTCKQKYVLLHSTKILKIVMEYWKYLLSLDRHWKSQNTNIVEMILMGIQDAWVEVVNVVVVKMMVKILLMTALIINYQIHMQKSHSICKYSCPLLMSI